MVDVKAAVAAAIKFTQEILEPYRSSNILLEEVERTREGSKDVWLITLSVQKPMSGIAAAIGAQGRDYKTVRIDAETGEGLSMKIRELASAR